jgi:hypothetical protein
METANQTDSCSEAHDGRKATAAHMRRAGSLHDPEGNGRNRGHSTGHGVVGRPGISEHSFQMPVNGVSLSQYS